MVSLKYELYPPLGDVWLDVNDITSAKTTAEVVYMGDPIHKLVTDVRSEIWNHLFIHVVNDTSNRRD